MFSFSRRRLKHGRLKKVQLLDTTQGTRSPIRQIKKAAASSGDGVAAAHSHFDELDGQNSSVMPEISACTSGSSENWMVLSIAGDIPTPRCNHAATVIGNKMIVVGGESGNGLLDDVQVLNFDRFSWTIASSKLYLSPSNLPLKIPACKGHALVSWGKKVLLIGGKTDPESDRISVWAFNTDTECWSMMEAKGDIPAARSGHTVVRANSVLILFGGEDGKRRKLNDLHMFDLKSLTWLPLHCTGTGPSPRSNHVAALYDDKTLFIFGGASKSRTLNDLYSLDFEAMVWTRIKIKGLQPSPRAGCCSVLCGTKWYISGGGSRKKRHAETFIFDILKGEWSVAVVSPSSSVTSNKGFSLVLQQHKEKDFLVAFGGTRKDPSNQVEVLILEKNDPHMGHHLAPSKGAETQPIEKRMASGGSASQLNNNSLQRFVDSVPRQNLASVIGHGSGRKSHSESLLADPHFMSMNSSSFRKHCHNDGDYNMDVKVLKDPDDGSSFPQGNKGGPKIVTDDQSATECGNSDQINQGFRNLGIENDDMLFSENDNRFAALTVSSSVYQYYESKMAALIRKNGILEGQLAAALASRESAEKSLATVLKSRQEMEKKLGDTLKEMELLREKLAGVELAQEEANSLSNIVHSDNVRLEHDVAFLKAVLDDTQKELHSTRGLLAGERARAFQLQVEVFHLKQRLQSMENRAPTPRKPFHV